MGAHILRFFHRLTPTVRFDLARTRSRIESMSDIKLFRYGCKRTESAWRNGGKRPLTDGEICELQVAREEWGKRKASSSLRSNLACAQLSRPEY
jgi:hypothetical protein